MQNTSNINIDVLVQQIHAFCPHFPCDDEQAKVELRRKLHDQLIDKIPQVVLEHLDLNCIIMNVKKSLSEFQRRIDESVAQQQLRRTTRVRKTLQQDPAIVNFFNPSKPDRKVYPLTTSTAKADTAPVCLNSKCCHEVSELSDLVQVESLPVSASTNLLTIFVPSILQEKLHSCKYKISIDLNRLDLTKKILDLNVGQQVNSNMEADSKENPIEIQPDMDQDSQDKKVTYEIEDNFKPLNTVELDETKITNSVEKDAKIEVKTSPETVDSPPPMEPTVSIEANTGSPPRQQNKRGPKRKKPKPPSNDPPKKRGRKPGSKNKKKAEKDEKSEIAKYVEMFACNAGSPSAVSQIVTSTTQNWDIMPEQNGQIAYFMNGEWTLSAPSNDVRQLVSTSNCTVSLEEANTAGQETFIPFEDFVNFIDNPSLDAGNNVIARVLDGQVDPIPCNLTPQDSDVLSLCVDMPQPTKDPENVDAFHQTQSPATSVVGIMSSTHSTANNKTPIADDGVLDLSKENNTPSNIDVLDLTQKKTDGIALSSDNAAERNVIFSTSHSMPSLDDMEVDLFCSTPERADNSDKKVVFSIAPNTSPTCNHKSFHSPEGESITDSAIDVERKDTSRDSSFDVPDCSKNLTTSLKDKTKPEIIKGMSLLEIEKDIDDSLLDFDNCMDDDLLSLAPSSCFNTPTEDRFASSKLLDVDESSIKLSTCIDSSLNSCAPAPRSHLELSFTKAKEEELNPPLKNFKIPRMKPAKSESPKELSPEKVSVNKAPKSPQSVLENAPNPTVSSIHRGRVSKSLFPSVHPNLTVDSSVTTNIPSQIVSTREISKMFGSLCFGFLSDMCFEINCKFSHQLLELSVIMTSLNLLRNEVLHSAYRFIWRHKKLFKFYFPIFCEEYARRNMRVKLANMITDCEMQPNCLPYFRNIHSALIGTGLNRINACRFILNRVKEKSHLAIDVLLEIIIESGASMFCNTIEQFSLVVGYKFQMKNINELATACLRSGSAELITVLIKCLINVDQAEFVTMRSPELIQLLEMIKNGGVDGM